MENTTNIVMIYLVKTTNKWADECSDRVIVRCFVNKYPECYEDNPSSPPAQELFYEKRLNKSPESCLKEDKVEN